MSNLELIKKLRKVTLAGFSSCQEALKATNYDFDKAIEWLQKKGINKILKRFKVGRLTNQGRVFITKKKNIAILLELRCETDFVSKNFNFKNFIEKLIILGFEEFEKNNKIFDLKNNDLIKKFFLKESLKFGETIELSNFEIISKNNQQKFSIYNHINGKYSAILILESESIDLEIFNDLAMQVVVSSPEVISIKDISKEIKEKIKKRIIIEITEKMIDKSKEMQLRIIKNKFSKELKSITLLNQKFIKDESKTIEELLIQKNIKIIFMKWLMIGD